MKYNRLIIKLLNHPFSAECWPSADPVSGGVIRPSWYRWRLESKHLIIMIWYNCHCPLSSRSTVDSWPPAPAPANMRITGYKLILLVSYIIILLFNLGTLYQLSYRVTPTQEAERTLQRGVSDQTSPQSDSYLVNNTESQSEENKNIQTEVKIEMTGNNSLYYQALSGTGNSWTLFDIRRGVAKKRLELIGLRLIIVDKIPFYHVIFFFIVLFLCHDWMELINNLSFQWEWKLWLR